MLNILTGFKSTLIKYASILLGVISVMFSLIFFGYSKGKAKAENEQTQKDIALLKQENNASYKVDIAMHEQQVNVSHAEQKHTAEKEEVVTESKETHTYDFGKWVVLLFFMIPFLVSCTTKESIIYKTTMPPMPVLKVYPRPEYSGQPITVTDGKVCMTEDDISRLFKYTQELKEVIKNYESQSLETNDYYDKLRNIYNSARNQ